MHRVTGHGLWGLAAVVAVLAVMACGLLPIKAAAEDSCALVSGGKPACTIVIADKKPGFLLGRAAGEITATVERWSGAKLPLVKLSGAGVGKLPKGNAIILATLEGLRLLDPAIEKRDTVIMQVGFADDQGFACLPIDYAGGKRMLIVSRTERGVFNGAVYLRDFWIDGSKEDLNLQMGRAFRSPQMDSRGSYTLIWGNVLKYTVKDWKVIFDKLASYGMDRVYFWVSGAFPSKKFPNTYNREELKGTAIGTVKDLQELIRYSHKLGMKFYLGSGAFAWPNVICLTEDHPETYSPNVRPNYPPGQCPSNSLVRQRHIEYFEEMIDTLPDADGFFFESREEWDVCKCPICDKTIDSYGSKQFGQAEITFLQELAQTIWRKHPHVRFAWLMGRGNNNDVAYYDAIRKIKDPRMEWWNAGDGGGWALLGPGGRGLPVCYFMHESTYFECISRDSLETMVKTANRIGTEALRGYLPGTESFNPPNAITSLVAGFAFRELSWEPILTADELRKLMRVRFFGNEAPEQLVTDLWDLYNISASRNAGKKFGDEEKAAFARMREHIQPGAPPKTKETLNLMLEEIDRLTPLL